MSKASETWSLPEVQLDVSGDVFTAVGDSPVRWSVHAEAAGGATDAAAATGGVP